MFNKSTTAAFGAMIQLAREFIENERGAITAREVARKINLPSPFVAKILTILSQHGMVLGSPGPNGGYYLARPPRKITLLEIVACFERTDPPQRCLFGPGKCEQKSACALHHKVKSLYDHRTELLKGTTLAEFLESEAG
ncbi:MAG: Rrf2 family transcriptional regulator [Myxococcales bacterium]|nr:MAG: Rrf2 family transcriptional regulator [Myxococcales bacterium]